jgi:hypothetical protein
MNSPLDDGQLLSGWNAALDIPAALSLARRDCVAESYVLVSMVDSTPNVGQLPSLIPLLDSLGANHSLLGSSVIIGGDTLLALVEEHEFFNGFDEIWLFRDTPAVSKPEAIPITSDIRLQQELPEVLVSWMRESGCIAGLGDGDGLNFATFRPTLAQLWSR